MGRILFLRVFSISLWTGFGRVHGKENALPFYACEAVSATGGRSAGGSRSVATEKRNDRYEETADNVLVALRSDLVWEDRDGEKDRQGSAREQDKSA